MGLLDAFQLGEGAHRACVLLGVVAACRTLGVPVQAYLTCTHREVFASRSRHDSRCIQEDPRLKKNKKPFQGVPVMMRTILERERCRSPLYSKPSARTITLCSTPS